MPIRRIAPRPLAPEPAPETTAEPTPVTAYAPEDIASGRGFAYEWEEMVSDVLGRLSVVESTGGGGGSAGTGSSYVHVQSAAAATWTVEHNLGTKPVVAVVSTGGDLLLAEIAYPSNSTTVITFGQPYAGSAYFRG